MIGISKNRRPVARGLVVLAAVFGAFGLAGCTVDTWQDNAAPAHGVAPQAPSTPALDSPFPTVVTRTGPAQLGDGHRLLA